MSSFEGGDFNIPHPISYYSQLLAPFDFSLSDPNFHQASETKYSFIKTSGSYTRVVNQTIECRFFIDLCFTNEAFLPFLQTCKTSSP